MPPREDARDALISRQGLRLEDLPPRPRIGTSSPRRAAQLLAARPDAQIVSLRGNLDTRLRKAFSDEYDAIVLAVAGLARLGLADQITQLPAASMSCCPRRARVRWRCSAAPMTGWPAICWRRSTIGPPGPRPPRNGRSWPPWAGDAARRWAHTRRLRRPGACCGCAG